MWKIQIFHAVVSFPAFTTEAHAGVPPVVGIPAVAGTVALPHIAVCHHLCIIKLSGLLIFLCFWTTGLSREFEKLSDCLRSNLGISPIPM
jgi:hypothetical protein